MQREDPPIGLTGPEFEAWNKKSIQDWEKSSRRRYYERHIEPIILTVLCTIVFFGTLIFLIGHNK